jgi:hypothetical protein
MTDARDTEKWIRRPAPDDMPLTFLVNRAGPKGHDPQVILSHDVEGAYVHYVRGRSVKCADDKCQPCLQHIERRWRGYLVVAHARTRVITLLELTAPAMGPIDLYFKKHRTLRGALIETKRVPEKANGRIYSRIIESAFDIETFPKIPSVRSILRKLWGLPKVDEGNGQVERKIREQRDDEDSNRS